MLLISPFQIRAVIDQCVKQTNLQAHVLLTLAKVCLHRSLKYPTCFLWFVMGQSKIFI